MKEAYLIIDIGTGTTRVAAVAEDGQILSMHKATTLSCAEEGIKGSCIFDPVGWWGTIAELVKKTVNDTRGCRIIAVTTCSLREGIVLFDDEGAPITGYMNSDRRGLPFMDMLDWELIWQEVGLYVSPIYSAVKMMGTRQLQPDRYGRVNKITSISDYVGYCFTGKLVWERTQAMHSAVYDPIAGSWSDKMCSHFMLDRTMLPPIAEAGSCLGAIKENVACDLGLNGDVSYIVGTADTQAALEGVGAAENEIVIVSGTTSPSVRIMNSFEKHEKSWTSPIAEKNKFMLEINTFSSGINLQRFKDNMLPQFSYEQLNEDAVRRGIPLSNLPKLFAVFSSGPHIDEPAYTGGFVMPHPIAIDIRPEDFYHALTMNTAMTIAMCLERHKEIQPLKYDYVIGCSNGFASQTIAKAVAGLSGLRVKLKNNWREATLYGMMVLCLKAIKGKEPEHISVKEYEPECTQELKDYYQQWKDCRKKINSIEVN